MANTREAGATETPGNDLNSPHQGKTKPERYSPAMLKAIPQETWRMELSQLSILTDPSNKNSK